METIGIGSVITDGQNQYIIEGYINGGGFADVYKASCEGTSYAVKVLKSNDAHLITSLRNEFNVAVQVKSEHAIKYYYLNELGQNDYPSFIIMEYANGRSLQEEIEYHRLNGIPFTTQELFEKYMQLIDGMIDISKVAVHRDIKPLNILVSDGKYKISDYGLAKSVNAETRSPSKTMKGYGSWMYHAPELWDNSTTHGINDIKVDIYAMGIVFYELANLSYPYDIIANCGEMHMTSLIKPFRPGIDPVFENLIRKMMAKKKKDRFDSWQQIKDYLDNSSIGSGIKRNPFVDHLLQNTVAKQQSIDARNAAKAKAETERITALKRLVHQIEEHIYNPLEQIVTAYNSDSTSGHIVLSGIDIDEKNETFYFQYKVKPMSYEEDERTIKFSFAAKHPDKVDPNYYIPNSSELDQFPEMTGLKYSLMYKQFKPLEYNHRKILLWGVIEADCGTGINIAILQSPDDSLYGDIYSFIRRPNDGSNLFFPIPDIELMSKCAINFQETMYHTQVEDFNFQIIQYIIQVNDTNDKGSIKDPHSNNRNGLIF